MKDKKNNSKEYFMIFLDGVTSYYSLINQMLIKTQNSSQITKFYSFTFGF